MSYVKSLKSARIFLGTGPFVLAACGGSGTLDVTTYGEDFIEQEIPAAMSLADEGFVDGFSARFDKFLIALSDLRVATADGEVGAEEAEQRIFDLVPAGPHAVSSLEVDAIRWDDVGVTVRPAEGAVAANATADDVALMNDGGYSVYVRGSVTSTTPGRPAFQFEWGLGTATRYEACVDAEESAGVVVPDGGQVSAQITVHGDHFFYDDLGEDPALRFTAMARADADGDLEVTLDELERVELIDIDQQLGPYGTSGDGSVLNLRQFVEALSQNLIHFQGEGHCRQVRL